MNTTTTRQSPVTGEARREAGRTRFTKLLSYMLKDISHPEMTALADWALNEVGCLHTSQLSHLKNAKMRMLGVKSLDALARVNTSVEALKASRKGSKSRQSFKNMDTAQTTARIEEIVQRYEPILHPETGEALNAGDLMMVYLGYLEIPGLGPSENETKNYKAAAGKLGSWIEALLDEKGMRFREAIGIVKGKWQGSPEGLVRFNGCASGISEYTEKELAADWSDITKVVAALMDEDVTETDLMEMVIA